MAALKTENEAFRERLEGRLSAKYEKRHERLLLSSVQTLEAMDRAIEAARNSDAAEALISGVMLVRTQLFRILQDEGLERVSVLGLPFDKRSAEERLAGSEQSDTDAMGLEKRRQVIGGRYSASLTRQIVTYVIVLGVIVGGAFGLKMLADDLDKPPAKVEDQAPWTGSDQKPAELQ